MIIKEFQLEKIIKESKSFIGILIYGPNEGLVKDNLDKITENQYVKEGHEHIDIHGKELDADPLFLDQVVNSISMFHKNKIVIANSMKDKHLKIIEEIVEGAPQNIILVIRDGNLTKSSKIRNFFEKDKNCFALACYEDDSRSIIKNIDEFINKNKFQINRDIKNYLLQSLSNDRLISKGELEKIEIFMEDQIQD